MLDFYVISNFNFVSDKLFSYFAGISLVGESMPEAIDLLLGGVGLNILLWASRKFNVS